jgi:hypothetical protein
MKNFIRCPHKGKPAGWPSAKKGLGKYQARGAAGWCHARVIWTHYRVKFFIVTQLYGAIFIRIEFSEILGGEGSFYS